MSYRPLGRAAIRRNWTPGHWERWGKLAHQMVLDCRALIRAGAHHWQPSNDLRTPFSCRVCGVHKASHP